MHVPFFSDELFLYTHFQESGGTGKGWERKIGYTVKEYKLLLERVTGLRKRLEEGGGGNGETITALDVERVAEVIFKKDRGLVKEVEEAGEKNEEKEKEGDDKEAKGSEGEEKRPAKKRRKVL